VSFAACRRRGCLNCGACLVKSLPLVRKPGSLITLVSVGSIVLAFLSILNGANAGEPSVPLSPGDHTIKLNYGERDRSALIHVPPRAPEQQHLPVVFNFHGGEAMPPINSNIC
jgi:poly(3-hydroxybutyrate) depolymerase